MNDLTRFIRPLAFVVAGMLVLSGIGLAVASANQDDDKYHITAYFEKAIGLFENSDVDILGVPVGKVTEVVPEGTKVRVEMEIDSQYKIEKSAETFAQIVPISVISDRYIQLGPVYMGEGDYLRDGDELDTSITQIPAELDDVFKQLKKLLDAIEPGKKGEPGALGDLIVQLNETLDDRERDLQGTLLHGAKLTGTLADAEEDLSGLLINLDSLFNKLATRADAMGELNQNFAVVMTALAQSRSDLEGTLSNLAKMTKEVGDLVNDHGDRLGGDLERATKITSAVVRNSASVEESLTWLQVVGEGVSNAYHGGRFRDVDVRDNSNARLECELFEQLPPGPIKEELKNLCKEETGEPAPQPDPVARETEEELNCDKGVRKVKRQLRRLEKTNLPEDALAEVVDPLSKQLRRLKRECKKLGKALEDQSSILEELPQLPDILGIDDPLNRTFLRGTAAGSTGAATAAAERSEWDRFTDWLGGFFSFLGVTG